MLKIGNDIISKIFLGTNNISAAYLGETQIFPAEYLTFEAAADNCQIIFYAVNENNLKTVQVSTDKITWISKTSSTSGTVLETLNTGQKLYIKGNNSAYSNNNRYSNSILPSANCYLYGNIMSLIDDTNFETLTSINAYAFSDFFNSSRYSNDKSKYILKKIEKNLKLPSTILANSCYYRMFYGCSSLTSAPELPATILANSSYSFMFYGCSSLTSAPELPATILADSCYSCMFYNCSNLTSAPELPATTLDIGCYESMFEGCSNLTSAPELPATTLANGCYSSMFYGCSSLTSAPELPATTLAYICYTNMFHNCSSLTSAPELPATTLADQCYLSMFYGCSSLTSAPELPATTLADQCYQYMFYNCSRLSYIKCLAITRINENNSTTNWVSGVASTGTFIKDPNAVWPSGNNGIPAGWTVQ